MAGKRYGIRCFLGGTYLLIGTLVGLSGRRLSLLLHFILLCWISFFLLSISSRCCLLSTVIYVATCTYLPGQFISSFRCCSFSTQRRTLFKQLTVLHFIVILWIDSPTAKSFVINYLFFNLQLTESRPCYSPQKLLILPHI